MALPTGTIRGSGLSRSEAAILAWKKRKGAGGGAPGSTLDPKIAARVKEILASRGKGKKKGKKGPDPAKAKAKAARAKEAAAKKQEREKAKAERLTAATAKKAERDKAKTERLAGQAKKLAERQQKLKQAANAKKQKEKARAATVKEKATASAAKQGEKSKVNAARQKLREKAAADKQVATQQHKKRVLAEKIKRKEKLSASDQVDAEDAGLVKKSGKALDMDDETDDLSPAIKAGARHSKMDASHLDEAARHLHAAGATCPDCAPEGDEEDGDAVKAIKGIMDDPAWYAQHECSDIMQAGSALSTIAMLIGSELSEEDEDDAQIKNLCDAADTLIEFIQGELSELRGAAGDAAEGRAAGAKGIELATLDNGEEIATVSGYAVKSLSDTGLVGGYLIKFGGDGDLSQYRDVFTKSANYGKHTKTDVWVHHRMLPGVGKRQLTNQAELGMDDEGVFVKHLLDLRSAYEAKLYGMVRAGKLGWSSGTAPHLVERKSLGDGRHEVTQWTLGLDASYTPMPAGGFVVNAGAMKSLFDDAGIDLLNAIYIDDSPEAGNTKSARPERVEADTARARRLSIQQRMIHLRETMNGLPS